MSRILAVLRDGMLEQILSDLPTPPIVTVVEYRTGKKAPFVSDKVVGTSYATTEQVVQAIDGAKQLMEMDVDPAPVKVSG